MPSRRSILAAGTLLATPALLPVSARAQGWTPSRAVRIIVPFTAGGATDAAARIMAERLSAVVGGSFVVENRAGAGGNVGADAVAKAEPDGHTLLMATIGTASINQFLYPNMPFNSRTDFASIAMVMGVANGVIVHPGVQAADFPALMALARSQPGRLTYATPGNGTSGHMSGEYMKFRAQVDITHVPYRGTGTILPDLMAGRVTMAVDNLPAYLGAIRDGRLKILAVTSAQRWFAVPEVPTVAESGIPGFQAIPWFGLQAPARTPAPALNRLREAVAAILAETSVQGRIRELGAEPMPLIGADFDRFIAEENDKWREVIRAANISLG
ncbi:Bug family tripartite tricarboxylate transporter substrate binding protein [Roseococcus thiosulfatophilus]|uniref:Bug family tripartite tricarboxylate transporter substrate binding protein n=1 Tax=Roseococcus thiosulfatophilus TaxID=35813 RepID=UPI001A8BF6C9|nr:tripartite tricarboxylate transporter substrate-binding protein [Roseococcus thiosulfatophilus]